MYFFMLLNKYRIHTIFIFAFIFFVILFKAVSSDCQMWLYDYKLMWVSFLGQDYKLYYEAPKPLIALFAGIVNPSAFYLLVSLFCALWTVCIFELAREVTGSYIHGIFAFLFCFFCNYDIIPFYFTSGYWPIFYIPLLFLTALFFVKKKYVCVFLSLFFAGLIRPESWVYFGLFIFLLWRNKEKIKFIYFTPVLAPFVWMFFDYKISGNPFYSHHVIKDIAVSSGYLFCSFVNFLPSFIHQTNILYRNILVFSGLLAIIRTTVYYIKNRVSNKADILIFMAILPFITYAVLSLKGNINLYHRFFVFSIIVIYFYASLLPYLFFKKNRVLNIIFLCLLLVFSFRGELFKQAVSKRKEIETGQQTAIELADYLENYLKSHKLRGKIITGGANSYFSYRFGHEFSQQTLPYGAASNSKLLKEAILVSELIISQDEPTPLGHLFNFLIENPTYLVYNNYILETIFVTSNKKGIITRIINSKETIDKPQ